MPQLRGTEDTFRPTIADRLRTRTADLEGLVRGMYVRGFSTQDVSALYHDTFGASRLSKSTVSRVGVMHLVIAAGGLAVALLAVKGLLRLRRSARSRIDVGVVSDAWLAEQRGARKNHSSP